jgi:hypothetical protein
LGKIENSENSRKNEKQIAKNLKEKKAIPNE